VEGSVLILRHGSQIDIMSRCPTASLQRALGLGSERAGQSGPLAALRCVAQIEVETAGRWQRFLIRQFRSDLLLSKQAKPESLSLLA